MAPFPPIPFARPDITDDDLNAVADALRGRQLSMGERVAAFEAELARRCMVRHAVAVCNGTAALHLALLAAEVGPGDEVITTPFTYVATANAILHTGATPVFADIDKGTFNLDMRAVEGAITKRTKALLPVHVFGRPCDLSRLRALAEAHDLALIEDACEALGSTYKGRHVGGFGLAGTLGFAPNKQITTAEGGALLTDRDDIADFARSMRRQGRSSNLAANEYAHAGYNYRLSDVHAALGLAQLRRLDTLLRAREAAIELYRRHLATVEGVTLPDPDHEGSRTSWFVWVVLVDKALAGDGRGRILANLNRRGIGAAHYFPALHLQPFLRQLPSTREGSFPNAEEIAARAIALPFFPGITEEQVLTVRDCLVEELQSARALARSV